MLTIRPLQYSHTLRGFYFNITQAKRNRNNNTYGSIIYANATLGNLKTYFAISLYQNEYYNALYRIYKFLKPSQYFQYIIIIK